MVCSADECGITMKQPKTPVMFYVFLYLFGVWLYLWWEHPRLTAERLVTDFWQVYVIGAGLLLILLAIYRRI